MAHREWVTWPSGRSVKWFPTAYSSPTLWVERPHPFWGVFMGDIAGFHWRTINRVRCDYCIPSNRLHNSVLVRALVYPTLAREFQGFRVWGKFVFQMLELTDTPTNLANQVKVCHAVDQSRSVQLCGPERAHQNNEPSWRSPRVQIAAFRHSFETINWLYLLFKCGIKTKTHFEWLLWHWSSLGQLNLEPIRTNGLVGRKVPTDLVKISVKEATHMVFYYTISRFLMFWPFCPGIDELTAPHYYPNHCWTAPFH